MQHLGKCGISRQERILHEIRGIPVRQRLYQLSRKVLRRDQRIRKLQHIPVIEPAKTLGRQGSYCWSHEEADQWRYSQIYSVELNGPETQFIVRLFPQCQMRSRDEDN